MVDCNNEDSLPFNPIDQSVVALDKLSVRVSVVFGEKSAYLRMICQNLHPIDKVFGRTYER